MADTTSAGGTDPAAEMETGPVQTEAQRAEAAQAAAAGAPDAVPGQGPQDDPDAEGEERFDAG
ncbi:hypothetical protein [Georgenia muralis]|uniref:Uncharacterized protein n=1 Tax=Georgenia muralis TaxID=154117 RepID=A0A3N4Z4T8_9MICO|nr:hypothetical protein [Georgenia muralis]RPF26736.1 hypothetical protein EDD32_1186 [Georgenia muralis]